MSAEQLFYRGVALQASGDLAQAERCFAQAAVLDPTLAEPHGNLGLLLEQRGAWDEAEVAYLQCARLDPTLIENHLNLGALYTVQKRFAEAEACYESALAIDDSSCKVWSNLGALYICWQRDTEAEQCLRLAMRLDDAYAKARFNLSYLLLRRGDYAEGWACMEARDWYQGLARYLQCPRWQGENLLGKSILIGYEAGHGDMIQFCRFAAVLKTRGARHVAMLCHPALKRLFQGLPDVDEVWAFDEAVPVNAWDCWTPPFSIPFYCETRVNSIPANLPYLHADALLVEQWKYKLTPQALPAHETAPNAGPKAGPNALLNGFPNSGLNSGLIVGLVWRGSVGFENDADRSLSGLETLAPLWRVPGVTFISLQKGAGEDQARKPPANQPLIDIGTQMRHFADAAAIVAQLNLVITVDTAMAHLAGALGKPCWLMLPAYKTDWRWLTDRTDSPWYPEVMRLYRQKVSGDWPAVVTQLQADLALLVETKTRA